MQLPSDQDRDTGRAPGLFLLFLALLTSVAAMSIDMVLPALDAIGADLGFVRSEDTGLIVLLLLAGLGVGQPVFGPLADSLGRRRTAALGWALYTAGVLLALFATAPWMILAGRFIQGIGAAGPRVVAMAMVRDLYKGDAMARMLSMVMTIFMVVPILAPMVGQAIEGAGGWRALFVVYLAFALVATVWHLLAVPETLAPERRSALRATAVIAAFREVLTTRASMCYALAATMTFATFIAYLSTAQRIYEEIYGLGARFPLVFALLAIAFAAAQYVNGRLVRRFGARALSSWAMLTGTGVAAIGLVMVQIPAIGPVPPLWLFLASLAPVFFTTAMLFANLNALALAPLGHIAGTAASAIMSLSTLGAVALGALLSASVQSTVEPLYVGFTLFGLGASIAFRLAEPLRAPAQ